MLLRAIQGTTCYVASHVSSSLWAVFDLSPGPFWLAAVLSTSVALMIALAHKARRSRRHPPIETAGKICGRWPSSVCDALRSGVLPQFSVSSSLGCALSALCGSESRSHHCRTFDPVGSGSPLRFGRQLSKLLVRHVGDDRNGRLALPAERSGARMGVPPRCRHHHARPDIRAVSSARGQRPCAPAHRHGTFSDSCRSAWHGIPCHLVVAASLLARSRVTRTSNSGGFSAHYPISAWHANDDVRDGKDHLLVLGGPCRA